MRNGGHVDASAKPAVLVLTGIGLTAAVALRPIAPLRADFQVLGASVNGRVDQVGIATAEDAVRFWTAPARRTHT